MLTSVNYTHVGTDILLHCQVVRREDFVWRPSSFLVGHHLMVGGLWFVDLHVTIVLVSRALRHQDVHLVPLNTRVVPVVAIEINRLT